MADISYPKEFLQEALGLVETLDNDRAQLRQTTAEKTRLENELGSLTRNIEQEKNKTLTSRRNDIENEYNKKLRTVENELNGIEKSRAKAREEAVRDRISAQTAGLKEQKKQLEDQLSAYIRDNKLPSSFKSRLYHRLFCPKTIGEWLTVIIIAALMVGALVAAHLYGSDWRTFIAVLAVDVVIVVIYVFFSNRTKGRYPNEVKQCREFLDAIRKKEKEIRHATKTIQDEKGDAAYDLTAFDAQLAQKNQERREMEAQKQAALDQFDNVTRQQIVSEIDAAYGQKLADATAAAEQARNEAAALTQKVSDAENVINANYVQFLGSRNLNREAIEKMSAMIDAGEASSVTDAVTRLSGGGK